MEQLRREVDELRARLARLEIEFRTIHHRIRSEISEEMQGMISGIEAHVSRVITTEMAEARAQLSKIDQVLELSVEAQKWRDTFHRVEVNEEAKKLREQEKEKEDALLERQLTLASKVTGLRIQSDTAIDTRIDGSHKRKIAIYTLVGTVLIGLLGGGAWSAISHIWK